jgi:hypothetical protein
VDSCFVISAAWHFYFYFYLYLFIYSNFLKYAEKKMKQRWLLKKINSLLLEHKAKL